MKNSKNFTILSVTVEWSHTVIVRSIEQTEKEKQQQKQQQKVR